MSAPASVEELVSHLSTSPYVRFFSPEGKVEMRKFIRSEGQFLYWQDKQRKDIRTNVGQTPSETMTFEDDAFTVTEPGSGVVERFAYLADEHAPII